MGGGISFSGEAQIDVFSQKTIGDESVHFGERFLVNLNIKNLPRFSALKMSMRSQVWAITGRGAVHVDLTNQATSDQSLQAIINRGKGSTWQVLFYPIEDIISSGMVSFIQDNSINTGTLFGRT
jgi:hypothetical protein